MQQKDKVSKGDSLVSGERAELPERGPERVSGIKPRTTFLPQTSACSRFCLTHTRTDRGTRNPSNKQSKNSTDLEERGNISLVLFPCSKDFPENNKPKSGPDSRAEIRSGWDPPSP